MTPIFRALFAFLGAGLRSRAAMQVEILAPRRDQPPMPGQDGVRGHDRGDLLKESATQRLPLGGQPAALVVGEAEAATARLKLLLQDAVLFYEIGDRTGLATANPASEGGQKEAEADGIEHPRRLSDAP